MRKRKPSTTSTAVLYDKDGAVAIISLNRPDVLNAYNVAMRDALFEALQAAADDPEVRAVILRGNGSAFCTGGDVSEFGSAPSPIAARDVRWRRDGWGLLRTMPKPVIAAVHGYAVGGGFEMALLCDLCVAAEDARFAYPETGLAMIPGVAGTQTTPRAIGAGRALDLILTGRWLTAPEAHRLGIVTNIVLQETPAAGAPDAGALRAAAVDLARRLCELPPALVARLKRAVHDGLDLSLVEGQALEKRMGRN
jgi:enoyl-CoA hydratase/carnithine racemase